MRDGGRFGRHFSKATAAKKDSEEVYGESGLRCGRLRDGAASAAGKVASITVNLALYIVSLKCALHCAPYKWILKCALYDAKCNCLVHCAFVSASEFSTNK